MNENRHIWRIWEQTLHRWGVREWVASFLEAAGPLNLLAAQVVYLGQPLMVGAVPAGSLEALARVLENPTERQAFVHFLREVPCSGTGA
jgi:hypothetical protein